MFPGNDSQATMREIAEKSPGLFGLLKRYHLKDLFDGNENLKLEEVVNDAILAHELGLELSVMIEDKTWNGVNPLPPPITHLAKPIKGGGGFAAIRWDSRVIEMMVKAMCAVQLIETVHSLSVQETAPSLDDQYLDEFKYTPQKYSNMYSDVFAEVARVVPDKPIYWYTNYFARDYPGKGIDDALERVYTRGVVHLGGPDWWPTSAELNERSYPRFKPWKSRGVKTFIMMSKESYAQPSGGGFLTPMELLDSAMDELGVTDVIWMYQKTPPEDGAYDYFDAKHLWQP